MNTVWLSLFSVIIIYALGIPLGLISGRYKDSLLDTAITGYTYLGFATPTFVFGLVMLWIFGYHFGVFPTNGSVAAGLEPGSIDYILSKINHLVLPSFSIALIGLVGTVQYLRSGVIEAQQKDYVMLARAKGVKQVLLYLISQMMPNLVGIIIVNGTLSLAANVGIESELYFLGFGFSEDYPSLGTLKRPRLKHCNTDGG